MPASLPFRIGSTSYVIPADLAANAEYLSSRLGEMELVLFDLKDGPSNLPDAAVQEQLSAVSDVSGLTYTVHLPLDLSLRDEGASLDLAKKVLDHTRSLPAYGLVAHIEGWYWVNHRSAEESPDLYQRWVGEAREAIQQLQTFVPAGWRICVENTENFMPEHIDRIIADLPAYRCIDVGHLLKQLHPDPFGYLTANLCRCRILHLHGLDTAGHDHQSIGLLPPDFLDRLLTILLDAGYDGVLTMEVFEQDDYQSSWTAVQESLQRIGVLWEH